METELFIVLSVTEPSCSHADLMMNVVHAAALCQIFALEEGITVPFMFGFVFDCLEPAAAFATCVPQPFLWSLLLFPGLILWFLQCPVRESGGYCVADTAVVIARNPPVRMQAVAANSVDWPLSSLRSGWIR